MSKRYRQENEKAQRPDQIWGTDIMYLKVSEAQYFFLGFIDEYSRYIVHWELLSGMDGLAVSQAMQCALETLPCDREGNLQVKPEIRSDNGSGYISGEFRQLLAHHQLAHQRITPGCPEENGVMERANRTVREAMEDIDMENRYQAMDLLSQIIAHYNHERLHSSLGFVPPREVYRGQPEQVHRTRRLKLSQTRHRRKQINLGIRQRTLHTNHTKSSLLTDSNVCHFPLKQINYPSGCKGIGCTTKATQFNFRSFGINERGQNQSGNTCDQEGITCLALAVICTSVLDNTMHMR